MKDETRDPGSSAKTEIAAAPAKTEVVAPAAKTETRTTSTGKVIER